MRKYLRPALLFCLLYQFSQLVNAQCSNPCPAFFTITDSINCNNSEVRRSIPGPGYSNNPFLIRTCKNLLMKYNIGVDQTCYAGTVYSLVSITGGTFIGITGNSFTIQWGGANTGLVRIAFATPGGGPGLAPCSDTMDINFTLVNTPVAAFTASPQPVCNNSPTTINFNSSATTNATGFYWNFGDAFTSVLANPSHSYVSPGTYTVTLIASNTASVNGLPACPTCLDTIQQNIVIDNLPGPVITCVATVCAGDTAKYCTTDLTCTGYNWTVTGGTILSGQNTACITVQWGSGNPQGSITLVPSGCTTTYCTQGTTVTVPIIPVTGTITGPTLVCNNTTTSYSLPSWPGTTYNWTLSGGGVFNPFNTNTNQVSIDWNTQGTHILTCNYFDSSLNCGGTANYTIFVRPNLSISGPATVCANQTTNLLATRPPSTAVNSNWVISPGTATINSGNGTSTINVTWTTPGIYNVSASPVVPNTTCNTANYTVTVLPAPVISSINGADSICPNGIYVYSATSNTTGLFSWSFSNAATFSLLGVNNDSVQVTWGPAGPYSITVSQTSIPYGCLSNTLVKNIFPYPVPVLSGPLSVCADANVTYTITNIASGNFQWSVIPANFGTILSGQGTNSVLIKWHGNNSPGSSNTVILKFGVCNSDSVFVTINEPPVPSITASGTLCGPGGITLSTGATGVFSWTGPGVPPPGNTSSITGVTIPGNYSVQIQNFNGTGCTVTANYTVPDIGRPIASISATNVLNYCLPAVPNMNLVAVNGPGYTFQWYQNNVLMPGEINPTLLVNTLTLAGTYTFHCVVTLGGCVVTSNTLTITISTCPPNTGCVASIGVTNISGCNPFTLTIAATGPSGATLSGTGNPTITHLEDNYTVSGLTTRTYNSIGYKQIRVCADVLLPNATICRVCKDTVVNVTVAANFSSVVNCKTLNLYDASTVVSPATISSYSWFVGTNPGNTPVPPIIASFNSNTIPNPVVTFSQSGSYIVNLTIISGSCTVTVMDTFNISVPDASFTVNNSCVGTTVNFANNVPAPTNFWDFGDASTSYVSPTSHAYALPNLYLVTHIVTDINGCKDTVINPIMIMPAPVCTVTSSGPLTFCFKDSVILGSSCPGLINFQWYNNGVVIPGATSPTDTVKQTGNYHFIAFDVNGCRVVSDTVVVTVLQGPNVNISTSGNRCDQGQFTVSVPSCTGCSYQWLVDGNPESNNNQFTATIGFPPYTLGTHTIFVQVMNGFGCTDTSSITVTFNPLPTVSINVAGPLPVCSNNLYTFTATTNATNPGWNWTLNNSNLILSTTNTLVASANGNYIVSILDSLTGCSNSASQAIKLSPMLNLFPVGCDTLCDSTKLFLPLASLNGNLAGYTINWYDNAPPYSPVIGTGVSFPLSTLPTGNHNISVIVTAPNGCMDTSTVYSIFTRNCSQVLAIKGLNISVRQIGSVALVGWSVEQEIDNDYFLVEKSLDGINFSFLQQVTSRGNSTTKQYYSIYDSLINFTNTIYYRVKAVDRTGTVSYSPIVKLKPSFRDKETLLLLPNVTSGQVNMLIQSNAAVKTMLQVYTSNGTLIMSRSIYLAKGLNNQQFDFSYLAPGYYFVTLNTGSSQLNERLIRQ